MQLAVLADGLGTRLAEETDVRPMPMVEIGGRPILWHILGHYAYHWIRESVIALGSRGEYIKRFFVEYVGLLGSLSVHPSTGAVTRHERWALSTDPHPHEARALRLASGKVRQRRGWRTRWTLGEAIDATLAWHRAWRAGGDRQRFTLSQITAFEQAVGTAQARFEGGTPRCEGAA